MQMLIRMLVVGLVLCAAARTTLADPFAPPTAAEAKKHFDAGVSHFNLRQWPEAIAEYKAGALIEPAPIFDYALGQAYRKSGDYEAADWHYARFVKVAQPSGEVLAQIEEWRAMMKAEREKKAMSQPPSEATPSPAPVEPPSPTAPASPRGPDWVGWSLVGSGVLVLAVGGGFFWSAASLRDDANSTPDQMQRADLFDKADTRSLLGKVFAVGGGAVAVGGIVKLALGHRDSDAPSTAWDLRVSPHSAVFAFWF